MADDDDLLEALAQSNCAQLLIGFEAAEEAGLRGLDSAGWKLRRHSSYHQAIRHIQSFGISVNGCFIMGLDSHTPRSFARTMDFIDESELAEVQLTLLTPFPGTALSRRLQREGRLLSERYWEKCTLFDMVYRPARMSPSELEQSFEHLMSQVYSSDRVSARRRTFRKLRRARSASSEVLS